MSQTWDEFSSPSDDADAAPLTDDAAANLDNADTEVSEASTAADWGQWNEATGDEAVQSADSYLDAAAVASSEGFDDAAAQDVADAGAQMDVASDAYGDAADNYGDAAADLTDASADVSAASVDMSDAGGYDAGASEE